MNPVTALGKRDLVIGVSVSEPSEAELIDLGLSELHVRHAFIEVCRHVLAKGWSVAYGGDLRTAGYTETMFDLARTYDRKDMAGPDRVWSYLPWPAWRSLTSEDRAGFKNVATLVEVGAPESAPDDLPSFENRNADDRRWAAKALTAMREEMTRAIHGRVILGGRTSGQLGLVPGVAEEALLAFEAEVPLYIVGGFGGCGAALAAVVSGTIPDELTITHQARHTTGYEDLFAASDAAGDEISFASRFAAMAATGIAGLRNGLDEADNLRLLATDDVDELVALMLRGLRVVEQDV